MQCPACSYIDDDLAFGDPPKCPKCDAFYGKAVIARAKKAEILFRSSEVEERKRKFNAAARPAKKAVSWSWRLVLALFSSRLFICALVVVSAAIWISMLAGRPADAPAAPPAKTEPPSDYAISRVGQRAVEGHLKDADSAKFRHQFVGKSGIPCGEVNAKNSFGAYTGFKRYMASGGGVAVIEDETFQDQFNESWRQLCSR
jgi:hypothetical protein